MSFLDLVCVLLIWGLRFAFGHRPIFTIQLGILSRSDLKTKSNNSLLLINQVGLDQFGLSVLFSVKICLCRKKTAINICNLIKFTTFIWNSSAVSFALIGIRAHYGKYTRYICISDQFYFFHCRWRHRRHFQIYAKYQAPVVRFVDACKSFSIDFKRLYFSSFFTTNLT